MKELLRAFSPAPLSVKHNAPPPKPRPTHPPLAINDLSIAALIASQQLIMASHMMNHDTLLQTLGKIVTNLKENQANQVVTSCKQLSEQVRHREGNGPALIRFPNFFKQGK